MTSPSSFGPLLLGLSLAISDEEYLDGVVKQLPVCALVAVLRSTTTVDAWQDIRVL